MSAAFDTDELALIVIRGEEDQVWDILPYVMTQRITALAFGNLMRVQSDYFEYTYKFPASNT